MDTKQWIDLANQRLRSNPDLSPNQVSDQLTKEGHSRPPNITNKGGRFGSRYRGSNQRLNRRKHEKTSTDTARERNKTLKKQRAEDAGVAEHSGLAKPHGEHIINQDSSDAIQQGAAGDLVENIPADLADKKTEVEQYIRSNHKGKYSVGLGRNGVRVIPKDYFDEIADLDSLPGIDIDEDKPIEDQLKDLNGNGNGNGVASNGNSGNGDGDAGIDLSDAVNAAINSSPASMMIKTAGVGAAIGMSLINGIPTMFSSP